MNRAVAGVFSWLFSLTCLAQSKLPSCPTDSNYWTDCFGVRDHGNNRYVGEFKNNIPHGQGTVTFTGGDKYVGELKDDKFYGQGTYTFANGNEFFGEWRDQRSGHGIFDFADGRRHIHEWKDDRPNGIGIRYKADRSIESSGTYAHGNLVTAHAVDPTLFRTERPSGALVELETTQKGQKQPDKHALEQQLRTTGLETGRNSQQLPTSSVIGVICPKQIVPAIPDRAMREGLSAIVRARIKVINSEIADVVIVSGPKIFHEEVIKAIRQYKCVTDKNEVVATQEFIFKVPERPSIVKSEELNRAAPEIGVQTPVKSFPAAESEEKQKLEARIREQDRQRISELEIERKQKEDAEEKLRIAQIEERSLEQERQRTLELETERRRRQEAEEKLRVAQQQQVISSPAMSFIGKRVALVIGNSNYKTSPLDNPTNDAKDVAAALRASGFETQELLNATKQQMLEATRVFERKVVNSDVALIYYAGHGTEVKGKNYMIPVGANIEREYELSEQAYDAAQWLDMLEGAKGTNAKRVNIVIFDACRNNPLTRGWRSSNAGLARMDTPVGTFLAYSTAPGKVASDGNGRERNSPFAKHLVNAIKQPNMPIEQVFKRVRSAVIDETKGDQIPWDSSSLVGDFFFTVKK